MMYNEEFYTNCSGVKFRKKKKKDKQEEDINSLHYKVQIRFQEDITRQKQRLQQILKTFQETEIPYGIEPVRVKKILTTYQLNYTPISKLSYSEFKDLLKEFSEIDTKRIENNFEIYKSSWQNLS